MRGDAVIYIYDTYTESDCEGYHDLNNKGIPYGYVFLAMTRKLKEPWSVALSHEVLELIADPETNLMVAGPHPNPKKDYEVFHWYEMCDAVQCETYKIDGIEVSNFVLPLYFTGGDEFNGRNDFLGTVYNKNTSLRSFGINPGGYIGFFDPELGKHVTYYGKSKVAEKRMAVKSTVKNARRAIRYSRHAKK
jgi:hypothetical protein